MAPVNIRKGSPLTIARPGIWMKHSIGHDHQGRHHTPPILLEELRLRGVFQLRKNVDNRDVEMPFADGEIQVCFL